MIYDLLKIGLGVLIFIDILNGSFFIFKGLIYLSLSPFILVILIGRKIYRLSLGSKIKAYDEKIKRKAKHAIKQDFIDLFIDHLICEQIIYQAWKKLGLATDDAAVENFLQTWSPTELETWLEPQTSDPENLPVMKFIVAELTAKEVGYDHIERKLPGAYFKRKLHEAPFELIVKKVTTALTSPVGQKMVEDYNFQKFIETKKVL